MTRPTSGRGTRRGRPPLSRDPSQGDFSRLPTTDSAEALYAAALDVARAAERVHARRSTSNRPRPRHAATVPAPRSDSQAALNSTQSEVSLHSSSTDDDDDDAAHARLTQSVSALGEPRGRTLTRNSTGLATPQNELEHGDTLDELRDSHVLEIRRRVGSRSQNRSGSQARARGSGRRAATVAFMGLGLLFWRGAVPGVVVPRGGGEGHVVERLEQAPAASSVSAWHTAPLHPPVLGYRPRTFVTFEDPEDPRDPPPPPPPKDEEPDLKEVIGRISAWCCTTLYLTSRLPQIWKNVSASTATPAPLTPPTVPAQIRGRPLHPSLHLCIFRQRRVRRVDRVPPGATRRGCPLPAKGAALSARIRRDAPLRLDDHDPVGDLRLGATSARVAARPPEAPPHVLEPPSAASRRHVVSGAARELPRRRWIGHERAPPSTFGWCEPNPDDFRRLGRA